MATNNFNESEGTERPEILGGLEESGGSGEPAGEFSGTSSYVAPAQPISAQQTSSSPQEILSLIYNPLNDYQFYFIMCTLIPYNELVLSLLNDQLSSSFHYLSSNDHVFYLQHPNDWQKHYRVTCKLFLHHQVTQILNLNNPAIIHNGGQMQQEFSLNHKINLELHLRKLLADHFGRQ